MKKITILLTALMILLSTIGATIPNPSEDFFVYDEDNYITESTKNNIINTNIELEEKTKAQVVVATIKDTKGVPLYDMGIDIFRKWKIGDKKEENGVLILIGKDKTTNKNRVEIIVGYGLEATLNDGKVGRIIDDYMIDNLKDGNYDSAIQEGFNAVVSDIASYYDVQLSGDYTKYNNIEKTTSSDNWIKNIAIIIFVIALFSFLGKKKKGGPGGRNKKRNMYYGPFIGGYSGRKSRNSRGYRGSSGGGGSTGGGGSGRNF